MENRKATRVKERNLDTSLIDSLRFKRDVINYDDLAPEVIKDIKNGAAAKNAYNDNEIRKRIKELEVFRDEEKLAEQNRINTPEQVEAIINNSISTLNADITKRLSFKIDKTRGSIEEHMLSRDLILKINRLENPEDSDFVRRSIKNAEDIYRLQTDLEGLSNQIHIVGYSVDNNTYKKSEKIRESDLDFNLITKLNKIGRVEPGTIDITAFESNTARQLNAAITVSSDPVLNYVQALKATLEPSVNGKVLFSSQSGPMAKPILEHDAIAFKDKSMYNDKVQRAKRGENISISIPGEGDRPLSAFKYIIYIGANDSSINDAEFYEHDIPDGAWTQSRDSVYDRFQGQFLRNHIDGELYYIANTFGLLDVIPYGGSNRTGSAATVVQNRITKQVKDITISSNSYTDVSLSSPYTSLDKVLVYDDESGSQTNGTYINSEGILTVSYSSNKVRIYNDASKTVRAKVIYIN